MVCVDQETGTRSVQPMKTLGRLRGSKVSIALQMICKFHFSVQVQIADLRPAFFHGSLRVLLS